MSIINESKEELLKKIFELEQENKSLKELYDNDIVNRIKADEALLASENRYCRLFESAKDGILFLDAESGKIIDVNSFISELLGYPYENFFDKYIWEIGFFNDIIPNQEKFVELLHNDYIWYDDLPIDTSYGKQIIVEFISNVYFVDNQKVMQCNVRDITERKIAEKALATERHRLSTILKGTNVGTWEWNIQTGEMLINERWAEIIGYTLEEISPFSYNSWIKFSHPEDFKIASDLLAKHFKGDVDYYEFESRVKHKNGDWVWVMDRGKVHKWDSEGKPLLMSGTHSDITARKNAEEALERRMIALTRPIDSTEKISLEDLFNISDIQQIQDDFSNATGVASLITKPDGTPITKSSNFTHLCNNIIRCTEKGLANCYRSDAILGRQNENGPVVQPCLSGGLWDAGASISVGGVHIANWLIGQVRNETQSEEKMLEYAREIDADEKEFIDAYHKVPSMSLERFSIVSKALFTVAKQLSLTAYQNVQQARFIAERKEAEEALRNSNKKWEAIVLASPDGIGMASLDGKLQLISEKLLSMYGYSPNDTNELLGKPIIEFIDSSYHKILIDNLRHLFNGEHNNKITEYLAVKKDKSKFYIEINSSILLDSKGSPESILFVQRDMQEREQMNNALIESEEKYRALVENSYDIIYTITSEGIITFVSPAWTKLLGHQSKWVVGQAFTQFVYEDDIQECLLWLQKVIVTGQRQEGIEYRVKHINGSLRWHTSSAVPFKDAEENVLGFYGTAHDITERKLAESALRESEEKYRALVTNSLEGIVIVNMDGTIIFANQALARTIEISDANYLLGKKVFEFLTPESIQSANKDFLNVENGIDSYISQYHGNTLAGREIWVESIGKKIIYEGKTADIISLRDITTRKKAEEALRESEEKLRSILENTDAGYFFIDIDGIIRDVNNAWVKLYGYDSADEIIGHHFSEIQKLTDIELANEFVNGIINNDSNYLKGEFSRKLKNDSIGYHTFSAKSVIKNGQTIGIEGFIIDTTEKRQIENALIESEVNFHLLFENMAEGVAIHKMIYDENGNPIDYMILDVNTAFEKFTSISAKNAIGKLASQLYGTDDPPYLSQYYEVVKNKKIFFFETHFQPLKKDFLISVVSPKPDHFATIFMDITERKMAEEALVVALAKAEESDRIKGDTLFKYNESQKIAKIGNWDWNMVTNEVWWSEEIYNIYGLDSNEYQPDFNANSDFIQADQIDEYFQVFQNCIETGTVLNHDFNIVTSNGAMKHCNAQGKVTYDDNHNPVRFIGTLMDITSRKEVENALNVKNEELQIAKKQAEENDKLKTAFLQNMSHEIRTPLNGIIGFSELLKEEELSKEEYKDFSNMISQCGKRLIEIVNNVLDISKIQTGQVNIKYKHILINNIFKDLLSLFLPLAQTKNIALNCNNIDNKYQHIFSDESKLNQILSNLINNALKFTKSGSIDFGFEVKDSYIQFYVKDTGIGISTEMYKKIFDRFIQAEQSLSRNYEGAGLGLAICKGLVELLGGKIWLESEINKGTTFFFTLPYNSSGYASLDEEEAINEIVDRNISGTILIAEDDWASFQYLNKLLKDSNITVIYADNGERALEMVKNLPEIDLVLMDIKMPVMDGIEATRQIKLLRPDLKVIAQTAYAFSEEKEKILAVGFDEYISKPIDKNKLSNLIAKNIKQHLTNL